MRDAGAEHTFWATSPPLPGDRVDDRHRLARADLAPHHGRRAAWATTRARACSTAGSGSTTSRTCVCTDSSVFPTSTGYGPTLTIVALAIRASRALAGLEPLRSTRPAT